MIRLLIACSSLPVILAGCGHLAIAATETAVVGAGSAVSTPGPNPPAVVNYTEDSITVWYDKSMFKDHHDEAEQLIRDHCGSTFEAERTELGGSFVINAKCIGSDNPIKIRPLP